MIDCVNCTNKEWIKNGSNAMMLCKVFSDTFTVMESGKAQDCSYYKGERNENKKFKTKQ